MGSHCRPSEKVKLGRTMRAGIRIRTGALDTLQVQLAKANKPGFASICGLTKMDHKAKISPDRNLTCDAPPKTPPFGISCPRQTRSLPEQFHLKALRHSRSWRILRFPWTDSLFLTTGVDYVYLRLSSYEQLSFIALDEDQENNVKSQCWSTNSFFTALRRDGHT